MTKRAVIYARVSSDEQGEHGYSIQTQIDAMQKYAEEHGLVVVQVFQENHTGAELDRPELESAREMLERNEADAFVVYTSDRLTRNLAHSIILREEFQAAGIELHTVSRGISENTAEGRLTENVEAVIAEYEPKLVIIDPLFSYTGSKNLNQESDSRPLARKLISIAQKFQCAGQRHHPHWADSEDSNPGGIDGPRSTNPRRGHTSAIGSASGKETQEIPGASAGGT